MNRPPSRAAGMPLEPGSLDPGYSTQPLEPAVLLVERDERGSPQLKKGTRRSWARPPPRKQVASARANKQQVRLEELCFQSGGLQRRAVPEEARSNGEGGRRGRG